MRLCADGDITRNSDTQHPYPLGTSLQGGSYPSATGADGCSGDVTACAMTGLRGRKTGAELGDIEESLWETVNMGYSGHIVVALTEMKKGDGDR